MTILPELQQSSHWVSAGRQDEDEWRTAVRVRERAGKIKRRRFDVLLAEVLYDVTLYRRNHLVWTKCSKYYQLLEAVQLVERLWVHELVWCGAVIHELPLVRVVSDVCHAHYVYTREKVTCYSHTVKLQYLGLLRYWREDIMLPPCECR